MFGGLWVQDHANPDATKTAVLIEALCATLLEAGQETFRKLVQDGVSSSPALPLTSDYLEVQGHDLSLSPLIPVTTRA